MAHKRKRGLCEYADLSTEINLEKSVYEPRALWSTQAVASGTNTRVELPRRHFRNGSKHFVVLDKLVMSGIGYVLDRYDVTVSSIDTFRNSMSIINNASIQIVTPGRRYLSKRPVQMVGMVADPIASPSMKYAQARTGGAGADTYPSGLWNLNRWAFSKRMFLPHRGGVRFQISGITPLDDEDGTQNIPVSFAFGEVYGAEGGRGQGHARFRERKNLEFIDLINNYGQGGGKNRQGYPDGAIPTLTDSFQEDEIFASPFVSTTGTNTTFDTFSSNGTFSANDFKRKEAGRAGSAGSHLTDFAVHMDTIDYDNTLQSTLPASAQGEQLAPIASRSITAAKGETAGTRENFWRPGAPLVLVSPSHGHGLVHRLTQPIVLAPGDSVQIELQVPDPVVIEGVGTLSPTYNLGVSFTGYAVVEGHDE